MKILLCFIASLIGVSALAAPDETSHRVCGQLYDDEHALSVQVFFKSYPPNTSRGTVVDDIAHYLENSPSQSDATVREKFLAELNDVRADISTALPRFAIVKTGHLPPKQLLFAYTDRQIEVPYEGCTDLQREQLNELRYFAEIMRSLAVSCRTFRCE